MAFSYSLLPIGISLILLILVRTLGRRSRAHSISHLPGPHPGPWLVGNLPEIIRPDNIAEAEFAWTNKYGTALRIKGALGVDVLFTADPKVIHNVLNVEGYNFRTSKQNIALIKMAVGEGITYAQGADHVRHRKIMNPAFSFSALRVFLPLFQHTSQRIVTKWEESMTQNGSTSLVLDIQSWLTRATLDALGHAAFNYDFGAIDEKHNELSAVYRNLFADSFFKRSDFTIAFEALWGYLPLGLATSIRLLPTPQLRRLGRYTTVAGRVAKKIVQQAHSQPVEMENASGTDVMSILVKANMSEDPKVRLSKAELMAQLQTLMVAGQETTASTSAWALYELSKHPDIQTSVREEIRATRAHASKRGNGELTIADLDSMKWLLAVMKETLRYHPIVTMLPRVASREAVLPLSTPLKTNMGEVVTNIPVSKGQAVILSLAAYNRLKSVWGEDADVWRPERFLEEIETHQKTGLGVLSNLATFGSGIRSCIGWRFAVLEMQAILTEFIEHFEFSPAPGNPEIIRCATGLMTPMVKGEPGRVQLPLTVTSVT